MSDDRTFRVGIDIGGTFTDFTVVDDALLEFRAAVPSSDYGKVRLGAPVEVSVDALPGSGAPW